jgi:AhpD family alkylhydroperoxidase
MSIGRSIETSTVLRADWKKASPIALKTMIGLADFGRTCGLEMSLIKLVNVRVSQLNSSMHCLEMQSKTAIEAGESEKRINVLAAWREAPYFTPRERAALAWAEAVTFASENRVPDELYEEVRKRFSEKELVDLTLTIVGINGWNRLHIAFRTQVPNV